MLVSTVGPFARWGAPAVQAAIAAGAHYLDSTGEGRSSARSSSATGPRARGGRLRAAHRLRLRLGAGQPRGRARAARRRRGGDARGRSATSDPGAARSMSGGTRASAAGVMLCAGVRLARRAHRRPSAAARRGRVVPGRRPDARRSRRAPRSTSRCRASHPGAARGRRLPRLVRRAPRSRCARSRPACRSRRASRAHATCSARSSAAPSRARTGGPDAAARAAIALGDRRRGLRRARPRARPTRTWPASTATTSRPRILAWGAQAAAGGGLQGTGALGPVAAFGLEALTEGARRPASRASAEHPMHRRVVRHSPTKRPKPRKFSGPAPLT